MTGKEWITSESPPRRIVVMGRSAMSPDCLVGDCNGRIVWIYPTGYIPDLGRNVFAIPMDSTDAGPYVAAQNELRRSGFITGDN